MLDFLKIYIYKVIFFLNVRTKMHIVNLYLMYLECNQGTYGKDCQHRCGSCINQTHCHYVNGTCLEGCGPGYLGQRCDEGNKHNHFCFS